MLIYNIFIKCYKQEENKNLSILVYGLSIIRIILCLFPQNEWITNDGPEVWGIIRNIPFVILGMIIIYLFFRKRNEEKVFNKIWIYILCSFLFYIPVVVGASSIPVLGMFMLPKTICYMLIIGAFIKMSKKVKLKEESDA